jgi:hypothetical protein
MKRVETLGLSLMAVFAMSAIATSAASAVAFEPNSTAVKLTAKNFSILAPNKLSVNCAVVIFEGKTGISSGVIPATAVLSFKECSAFGVAATVTETCGTTKDSIVANSTTSATYILAAGCKIVIKTSTCSMTAEGKQELKGTWTNGNGTTTNSGFALNMAPLILTSTGGICGASGTGAVSGTFTVEPVTVKIK